MVTRSNGPRQRRSYSAEYKAEVVREVLDTSRSARAVAMEQGIDEGTVRKWVATERRRRFAQPGPVVDDTRQVPADVRIRELERELREARQEAEFLKKAAAFFARDHR